MTPARAGTSAVAAVVGATVLLLVLVTWAASIGPDDVLRGPGIAAGTSFVPSPTTTDPSGGLADLQEQARLEHAHDGPPPLWYRFLAVVVELSLAGLALLLLTRGARSLLDRWRARRRPLERSQAVVDFEVLDAGPALASAIQADAGWQRTLLDEGEPRNAIVACWDRFETAAERAGVRRRSWQTASEFVLEVLEEAGADPHAVVRLAELYREARFSDHPVTEDHRRRAFDALEDTHHSLLAASSGRP